MMTVSIAARDAVKGPAVSVTVPNYNHARFLRQRIDSILNQTFQDFELILLDDASTDDSVTILEEYAAHPRVTHFAVNDSNSGRPCQQWEKGIQLSSGNTIWIAESDDWAHPEFLERMYELLHSSEQNVLASCRSRKIDVDGQPDSRGYFWADAVEPGRWNSAYSNNGPDEIRHYLSVRNTIPNASAVVFKRIPALRVSFPSNLRFTGDWVLWLRLLRHGNLAYAPEVLNQFRMHSGTTRAVLDRLSERQRITEYLMAISESGAGFHASVRPCQRDHSWILNQYRFGIRDLPFWVLKAATVPFLLRLQFFVHAAIRCGTGCMR